MKTLIRQGMKALHGVIQSLTALSTSWHCEYLKGCITNKSAIDYDFKFIECLALK